MLRTTLAGGGEQIKRHLRRSVDRRGGSINWDLKTAISGFFFRNSNVRKTPQIPSKMALVDVQTATSCVFASAKNAVNTVENACFCVLDSKLCILHEKSGHVENTANTVKKMPFAKATRVEKTTKYGTFFSAKKCRFIRHAKFTPGSLLCRLSASCFPS